MPQEGAKYWLDVSLPDDLQAAEGRLLDSINLDGRRTNVARARAGLDRVLPEAPEETTSYATSGIFTDAFDTADPSAGRSFSKLVGRSIPVNNIYLSGTQSPAGGVHCSGLILVGSGEINVGSGDIHTLFTSFDDNTPSSGENWGGKFLISTISGNLTYPEYYTIFKEDGVDVVGYPNQAEYSWQDTDYVFGAMAHETNPASGALSANQVSTIGNLVFGAATASQNGGFMGPATRVIHNSGAYVLSAYASGTGGSAVFYPTIMKVMGLSGIQIDTFWTAGGIDEDDVDGRWALISSGDCHWGYRNNVLIASGVDLGASGTTIFASGYPGIGFIRAKGNTGNTVNYATMASGWRGGSLDQPNEQKSAKGLAGGAFQYDSASGVIDNDQYAKLTVKVYTPDTTFRPADGGDGTIGPAVRCIDTGAANSGSCYFWGLERLNSTQASGVLYKVSTGTPTAIQSVKVNANSTGTYAQMLIVRGSTLYCYHSGALVLTHTDTAGSPLASGVPGVAGTFTVTTVPNGGESGQISNWYGDTFEGGSLITANLVSLGTSAASGYFAAMAAFTPFGEPSYLGIDSYGRLILYQNPSRIQ